jgi:4-hydroxy-tetrahydrodipicolinate synthase
MKRATVRVLQQEPFRPLSGFKIKKDGLQSMICSGIYTALITPFDKSGNLDIPGICQLVERQMDAGIDGLVALGTTGEAPTLSQSEKGQVIRVIREKWSGPLMVGCGSFSTTQTINNIHHAASLGADSVLVITPFYNKPTQEGLFRHYAAICNATSLPIIVYNNPGRTGVHIETATLQKICDLNNIVGIKEASGSISHACDILYMIQQNRPDFALLSGDDNLALATMSVGGNGLISAASNLIPTSMKEFLDDFEKGKLAKAKKMNRVLTPFFKALLVETNPIPLKTLLNLARLPAGEPRLPLTPLSSKWLPLMKDVLNHFKKNKIK